MLYLIRHTRPDIAPGICYGQLDVELTNSFETEANAVANHLSSLNLIITSPLLRTRKLAEHLARRCDMRVDARLMEKHFGVWEGRAWNDIARCEIDAWAADIMGYAPQGGESAQQVMQRVQAFMHDAVQLPQQNIAVIAHGGTIRAILALLADIPLIDTLNWEIEYGAVIAVRFSGHYTGSQTASE